MKGAVFAFAVLALLVSSLAFATSSSSGVSSSLVPKAVSSVPVATSANSAEIMPYPVTDESADSLENIPSPSNYPTVVAVSTINSVSLCIDEELNSEIKRLYSMLNQEGLSQEQVSEIKARIEKVNSEISEKKASCYALQKNTVSSCYDDSLNKELSSLALKLNEAEQNGDSSLAEQIRNRKEEVIRIIKENKEHCASYQSVAAASSGSSAAMGAIASCQNLENYREKLAYLEKMIMVGDVSEDRASAIKADIETVRKYIAKYEAECNERTSANLGNMVSEAVKEKEGGAGEIVAYYKARVSAVISSGSDTKTQIEQLKHLRDEIDSMIRDMMEKQSSIEASEISTVVSEIKVLPSEISADNVRVAASGKKVIAVLRSNPVEIASNGNSVVIDSDGISAEAEEILIANDTILVGSSEIGVSPSAVISSLNVVPKKIEIVEEENRSVYKIRSDENRNLLGLIAVRMEKKVSVDGMNGSVISQETPWWSFLTTAAE